MKGSLIVLVLGLVAAATAKMSDYEDMKDKIDRYNLYTACYGHKIMRSFMKEITTAYESCKESDFEGLNDLDSLTADALEDLTGLLGESAMTKFKPSYRKRRDASSEEEEDIDVAREHLGEYKESMKRKLASLACVLKKFKYLDEDGEINMAAFSYDVIKAYLANTPAGNDEEYLQLATNMFQDCYDISQSWPQTMLDRNPVAQKIGRKKIFFECMFKAEGEICYKWLMYNGFKMNYGIDTAVDDLGLQGNKFEKAKTAWLTMYNAQDPEYQVVNDLFFSKRRM